MEIQDSFGYILNINAKLIKRRLEAVIKKYDITTAQWSLLKLLAVSDNLTQVEIANRLHSDIVTIGLVVERLVKKEMLQKTHAENDRRAYRISITDSGRTITDIIEEEAKRCNKAALQGFNEKEIEILMSLLNKVTQNLIKEN
jgi:DNA-binding MarR family transcriptional regulator